MTKISGAKVVSAGLAIALLSGCSRFHPRPVSAAETAADFESRTLSNPLLKEFLERNTAREMTPWPPRSWDFTNLMFAAFYYHPDLDVARAKWGVAGAGKLTASERPNPTANFTPTYDTTTPPPWILGLSFDIPLETAGKRGFRIAEARHLTEAAQLSIAAAAWQVRSRLRRSWLDVYSAREIEGLLRSQQSIQSDVVKLLEAQLAAGAVSPNEVTLARITLNNLRLALHDAERQGAEARVQLADAIGLPVAALEGVEISFAALTEVVSDLPSAEVRRQALLNRADLLSALAEYAASQSALQLEIARQYPDVHLGPGYQLDQTDNKWSLGLTATLPILNQNQGPVAEAEARRTEAAARFTALQSRIIGEIDRTLAGYRIVLQKIATADAVLADTEKRAKTAQAMFDAGEISRLDLSSAQLELSNSSLARLDTLVRSQQALGLLEDALQSPSGPAEWLLKTPPRNPERMEEKK
jgi:outer membrane protein TolC